MQQYVVTHHRQFPNKRAISFIAKSKPRALPILTGKRATIAFRAIHSHNLVMQICKLMPKQSPVIATSANISGHVAQHHFNDVYRIFKDKKSILVLRGYGKFYKKNSRIINLLNDLVVRD
jgi:tRNA A37 threonylcarbamoyladenosine synthetase subunit TsaC/SUA5/YrdC